jgi:hypothetical protein
MSLSSRLASDKRARTKPAMDRKKADANIVPHNFVGSLKLRAKINQNPQ